jgi:2-methylisocitrate lyase-like PEP mutase family enzyme
MLLDIAARRADFRALHDEGYFLLPTAGDVGGAKRLEALGYAGLATTNASLAGALGRDGGRVTCYKALAHFRQLVNATEIPVNGDFATGFATGPAGLVANVRQAIDTGISALSISDNVDSKLNDFSRAATRIKVCRHAIAMSGQDVLLVARTEGLISGRASVSHTIQRLVEYSKAGADVFCAPGLSDSAAIREIVVAIAPKPLDLQLMEPGLTAMALGQLGVRRLRVRRTALHRLWRPRTRTWLRLL